MSSIWVSNCRAIRLQSSTGPVYIMDEETTESNVSPRRAHWCAMWIGSLEHCLQRAIINASYAEGGGTRGPNGRAITPETYIRWWMDALSEPVVCAQGVKITMTSTTSQWGNGVHVDKIAAMQQDLANAGIEFTTPEGAKDSRAVVDLDNPLHVDFLVLANQTHRLQAWMMGWSSNFANCVCGMTAKQELPDTPIEAAPVVFYRDRMNVQVGQAWVLATQAGRVLTYSDEWAVVTQLIRNQVATRFKAAPAQAIKEIRRWRKLIKEAPIIGNDIEFTLDEPALNALPHQSSLRTYGLPQTIRSLGEIEQAKSHRAWQVREACEAGLYQLSHASAAQAQTQEALFA